MKLKPETVFSKNWCDLVFEKRNKSYGAFQLRKNSPLYLIIGFFVGLTVTGLILLVIGLTFLAHQFEESNQILESNILSVIKLEETTAFKEVAKKADPVKNENKVDDLSHATTVEKSSIVENYTALADSIDKSQDSVKIDSVKKEKSVISGTGKDKELSMGNSDTSKIIMLRFTRDAMYPGGENAMAKFIQNNLNIPKELANIHGTIEIIYTIDTRGFMTRLKIKKPLNPLIDNEILRIFNLMPKWQNAVNNNIPVARPSIYKLKL